MRGRPVESRRRHHIPKRFPLEHPTTIAQLRQSEYRVLPVKEEMRKNLVRKIKAAEELFPGIIGFEGSVVPQVENAILSGQDIVFLGERGQAKSRLIRTHYPRNVDDQIRIVEQERTAFQDRDLSVVTPDFMKEIVAEVSQLARRSPKINQRSGVSVRISITNYENLVSNASRRALRTGETEAVPRITDLPAIIPSSAGKLEMETWEEGDDQTVLEKIIKTAVLNVFRRHFEASQFNELVQRFDAGLTFEVSE